MYASEAQKALDSSAGNREVLVFWNLLIVSIGVNISLPTSDLVLQKKRLSELCLGLE